MCFVNGQRRRNRIRAWTQSTIRSQPVYPGHGSAPLRLVTRAGGNLAVFLEEETPAPEVPEALCSRHHGTCRRFFYLELCDPGDMT